MQGTAPPGGGWTGGGRGAGHRTVESSAIGPHQQTYALIHQVSRGRAAAHIVPSVQQGAVRRRHKLFKAVRERHWRPLTLVIGQASLPWTKGGGGGMNKEASWRARVKAAQHTLCTYIALT